jgi:hypothetical protein
VSVALAAPLRRGVAEPAALRLPTALSPSECCDAA